MITLGLKQINTGVAAENGIMPSASQLSKIGKVYKGTCKIAQDAADVTEHFEEGNPAPVARFKIKKIQKVTAQIIVESVEQMAQFIGGTITNGKYGYDGTEVVANRSVQVITKQGLNIEIPNADIEAALNADLSSEGICLFDITFTPMATTSGKAYYMVPKPAATATPASLTFAASGETKTVDVTAENDISFAFSDNVAWCNVSTSGKTATVVCNANDGEQRTATITINVDGSTLIIPVTQSAGA